MKRVGQVGVTPEILNQVQDDRGGSGRGKPCPYKISENDTKLWGSLRVIWGFLVSFGCCTWCMNDTKRAGASPAPTGESASECAVRFSAWRSVGRLVCALLLASSLSADTPIWKNIAKVIIYPYTTFRRGCFLRDSLVVEGSTRVDTIYAEVHRGWMPEFLWEYDDDDNIMPGMAVMSGQLFVLDRQLNLMPSSGEVNDEFWELDDDGNLMPKE